MSQDPLAEMEEELEEEEEVLPEPELPPRPPPRFVCLSSTLCRIHL